MRKFLCIKDFIYDGKKYFTKGKTYLASYSGSEINNLIDDYNNPYLVGLDRMEKYFIERKLKTFEDVEKYCTEHYESLNSGIKVIYRENILSNTEYLDICNCGGNLYATDDIEEIKREQPVKVINSVQDLINFAMYKDKEINIGYFFNRCYSFDVGYDTGNIDDITFMDDVIVLVPKLK